MVNETVQTFELEDVLKQVRLSGNGYHEFLRVTDLSTGIYHLTAGEVDPQSPHGQDEVYYVLEGRARIEVEGEIHPVRPGTLVYVRAYAAHKFFDIEKDLQILVFFAPAET
jgi:mannose-6-phosphate isomerase-like protein (cupin superfamily)